MSKKASRKGATRTTSTVFGAPSESAASGIGQEQPALEAVPRLSPVVVAFNSLEHARYLAHWGNQGLFAEPSIFPYKGGEEARQRDLKAYFEAIVPPPGQVWPPLLSEAIKSEPPPLDSHESLRAACLQVRDALKEIARFERMCEEMPEIDEVHRRSRIPRRNFNSIDILEILADASMNLVGPGRPDVPWDDRACKAISAVNALIAWCDDATQALRRETDLAEKTATNSGENALNYEAKALAVLCMNPEFTHEQVAAQVGCHVKSLFRFDKYQLARAALKSGRTDLPRGSKNAGTGKLEAWDK